MLRIIGIENSYCEFNWENVKTFDECEDMMDHIDSSKDLSYFELINDVCRPYFDIENVPEDIKIEELINIISSKLSECFNFDKDSDYILTENTNSSNHMGLSYHLIFNKYYVSREILGDFVSRELDVYANVIDKTVYSKNRLFRLPYMHGITKDGQKDMNSIHKYKYIKQDGVLYSYDDWISKFRDSCICRAIINNIRECASLTERPEYTNKKNIITKMENLQKSSKRKPVCRYALSQNTIEDVLETITNVIYPKKKEKVCENIDETIFDKAVVLNDLIDSERCKNILNEVISYYNQRKSFESFRMTTQQIKYLLKLIESKI